MLIYWNLAIVGYDGGKAKIAKAVFGLLYDVTEDIHLMFGHIL